MDSDKHESQAVAIVGTVGGISIAIVVIFAVFARDQMAIAAWMVGALALMGVIVAPLAGRRK